MAGEPNIQLRRLFTSERILKAFETIKSDQQFAVEGCHIELVTENRFKDVLHFLRDHYYPHEPMCKSLNVQWDIDVNDLIMATLQQNLSTAIVEDKTGTIIGGLTVAIDSKHERFDPTKYKSEELIKVIDVTANYFDKLFNIYDYYKVEEAVHIWQLAVHKDHRQKGIASKLVAALLEFIRSLGIGPVVVRVEGSHNGTKRIVEKLGFDTLAEVVFADYRENGKVVFPNTGEHTSEILYGAIVE